MILKSITSNNAKFKPLVFQKGLNVILAEKSEDSTDKDSRNGLGKSSAVEILHFCLGADFKEGIHLGKDPLKNWIFSLEFEVSGESYRASRSTSDSSFVVIEGNYAKLPLQPVYDEFRRIQSYELKAWNQLLGHLLFDLPLGKQPTYSPSFRSLISFFARRGKDAFNSPFEVVRKAHGWSTQVLNTFLLGLNWEHARDWQLLKLREEELAQLGSAIESGVLSDIMGSRGELEALRLRLEEKVSQEEQQLSSFQVHPQYKEIEANANRLTEEIHDLSNQNVSDEQLLTAYEKTMGEEHPADPAHIKKVYDEAKSTLPDKVLKHIEEVQEFHKTIVANRKVFLQEEIKRIRHSITQRNIDISKLSNERSKLLGVLKAHRALDEYNKLQQIHLSSVATLNDIQRKIENIRKFEEGKSALKIERETLVLNARRDYEERKDSRTKAISFFNSNSQALYNSPGKLIINIKDSGFQFGVSIERSDSAGVQQMEVFCYDLMLAQLWSGKSKNPGFLFHDSTLFADVDERQVAHAIELAASVSAQVGFQYICCLNSDHVPYDQFTKGFDFKKFVRLELTDTPTGGIFGMRF